MDQSEVKKEDSAPESTVNGGTATPEVPGSHHEVKSEPQDGVTDAVSAPAPTTANGSAPVSGRSSTEPHKPASKRQKVSEEPELPDGPTYEIVGGSSVRQYLNRHLTAHLLEGLKQVGNEKPDDPLRWLGEFLIERASQIHQ